MFWYTDEIASVSSFTHAIFADEKRKPTKKNLGLYGIRTLDLWDTGAALLPIELTSQLGAGH